MKKKEDDVRNIMVVVRLNKKEHATLTKCKSRTTEKKVSTYLRKVALNEPVTVIYRNGSADDFLKEMLELKRELNAIGNNFNQAVHKLHTLDRIPEFRNWIRQYETVYQQFLAKTDQIMLQSKRIYQLWLQE
ncbi:plasmid mobilization relaxosome protein MobC [Sediminibacterium roseum]|uniref:Plasmid mobilization relaxosome protein MobC n=1 Tax=Sediminibacterium roseum TaxID=1978412 RepID=A0ABW9ZW53_9BACT|nr:plasmid mobilization relaxosome protein MobC [Sediminibacterium roseum]NCI51392.1 plasmid mobilization relaxosome protein MobC [Sediminibacterium roseum]